MKRDFGKSERKISSKNVYEWIMIYFYFIDEICKITYRIAPRENS